MRVAVQMDRLDKINPQTDSTLCLIEESLKRNFETWYYTPDNLYLKHGQVFAVASKALLQNGNLTSPSREETISLSSFDVVLMRQDPPISMDYLTSTYILEKIHPKTLVANNPSEVRNLTEKLFICSYPDLMPPTLVAKNPLIAQEFLNEYQDIIIKPLYEFGGKGIIRVEASKIDTENFQSEYSNLQMKYNAPLMLQKFLHEVAKGDKRVFLIEGKFAGAINRVPKDGDIKANLALGGRAEKTSLNRREQKICDIIGHELSKRGIIFAGIDIIGGYLTEVNITSPTGIKAINSLYNLIGNERLEYQIWQAIEKHLQ